MYLPYYCHSQSCSLRERGRARDRHMITHLERMDFASFKKKTFLWYLAQCLVHRRSSRNICQIELLKYLYISMDILFYIHTSYLIPYTSINSRWVQELNTKKKKHPGGSGEERIIFVPAVEERYISEYWKMKETSDTGGMDLNI